MTRQNNIFCVLLEYGPLYMGRTHRRYVYHFPIFIKDTMYEVDLNRIQEALKSAWSLNLGRNDVTVDLSPAHLEYVNMNG